MELMPARSAPRSNSRLSTLDSRVAFLANEAARLAGQAYAPGTAKVEKILWPKTTK